MAQEAQDEPKRIITNFKEPDTSMYEKLKNTMVFIGFWQQKHLKTASRGPTRLPKGTQRKPIPHKNKNPTLDPQLMKS